MTVNWNEAWGNWADTPPPQQSPMDWDSVFGSARQLFDFGMSNGGGGFPVAPPAPEELPPLNNWQAPADDQGRAWSDFYQQPSMGWQYPETSQTDTGNQFAVKAPSVWDDLTNNVPATYFNTHDNVPGGIKFYMDQQGPPDQAEWADRQAQQEENQAFESQVWKALIGEIYTPPPQIPPPLGPSW